MSRAFDAAVEFVLRHEGGLVDDPRDPGRLTKFGVSQRSYPTLDIRRLTREEAIDLYRRDFWEALDLDRLPSVLAIACFDSAVNMGTRPAVRLLQLALGVAPDGVLGPATCKAAGTKPAATVLDDFLAHRAVRYAGTKTFERFGFGWMRRTLALHRLCCEEPS